MIPVDREAYQLMHDGAIALAQVEATGVQIDVPYLERTIAKVGRRIDSETEKLKQTDEWKVWEKKYGREANLGSRPQLGQVLFKELGHTSRNKTKTGRFSTTADDLEKLDILFVRRLIEVEKLKKLQSTYLQGILRETVDGILHAFYNLHLARTYRSSSDSPNFQNLPIRDGKIAKLLRRAFIPRKGRVLVEVDYGGHEFKIAACFWKDPAMVDYASDPKKDIHRDMAMECYKLPVEQVTKKSRFHAKNSCVFPQLYGDYYVNCAKNLWNAIDEVKLKTADGMGMKEHLSLYGVGDARAFELHIKHVEEQFNRWFPVFAKEKYEWWDRYCCNGYFRTMTGFVVQGVYTRNQVFNFPVQGPAFHCLLWSLIRVVRWLRKHKMKSRVIGQIHDSLLLDVVKGELDDVLAAVKRITLEDLRKAWKWIIVPLGIDIEGSDVNWFEKGSLEV